MRKIVLAGTVAGGLVTAAIAGATFLAPVIATAADPSASAAPAASGAPVANAPAPGGPGCQGPGGFGPGGFGPGGFGGRNEAVSDTSVVAGVIGVSEVDLTTALRGGQSIAAVAKAHNVDVQKVVDALVADARTELAAAVKAGSITQAQADAQQANLVGRVTDHVNNTRPPRGPGDRPQASPAV